MRRVSLLVLAALSSSALAAPEIVSAPGDSSYAGPVIHGLVTQGISRNCLARNVGTVDEPVAEWQSCAIVLAKVWGAPGEVRSFRILFPTSDLETHANFLENEEALCLSGASLDYTYADGALVYTPEVRRDLRLEALTFVDCPAPQS